MRVGGFENKIHEATMENKLNKQTDKYLPSSGFEAGSLPRTASFLAVLCGVFLDFALQKHSTWKASRETGSHPGSTFFFPCKPYN